MANNYTTTSLEALKYLCSVINKTVDLPNTVISDTSIATNTTHSSFMLNKELTTLQDELIHYTDTAIAGLNKLTKEVINDRALVVKDNVLYLYKAADDPSNDYMQMMLINGVAVELGSTQVDMSDYYNKADSDNRFAAKLDLDTLTTSFNDLVGKVSAIEDEIGTETLTTTNQTLKGAINEVADKSEIVTLTKAEYEALTPKDAETYYITSDDMTMYKGVSKVLGGKSLIGKETVLYNGSISATGTYDLADNVNNYDFIIINYTALGGTNAQSLTMSKIEISKCIDASHCFMCVYGYAANDSYITGYFNNDKLILNSYSGLIMTSIVGYKFGQVGESYSTDEQIVGTWIDGKPIYRKVIQVTVTKSDTFEEIIVGEVIINGVKTNVTKPAYTKKVDISSFNMKRIVRMYGSALADDSAAGVYCPCDYGINAFNHFYCHYTTNSLIFLVGKQYASNNTPWDVVLEYIKTTD